MGAGGWRVVVVVLLGVAGCGHVVWSSTGGDLSEEAWRQSVRMRGGVLGGTIYIHTPKMRHIRTEGVGTVLVGVGKWGSGAWSRYWRTPWVGLTLVGTTFGNAEVLGYAVGLAPSIALSVVRRRGWFVEFFAMSGVAFLTRTYWESNLNTAIATKVNNVSGAGWIVGYRWLGLALLGVHYSNGRFRMPNLGINTVVGGVVLRWRWWEGWHVPVSDFQPGELPRRSLWVEGSVNWTAPDRIDPVHYVVYTWGGGVGWRLTSWIQMHSSLLVEYNQMVRKDGREVPSSVWRAVFVGVEGGPEFVFHRVGVTFFFGTYLYQPVKKLFWIYNRTRFRIYCGRGWRWGVFVQLKSHWAVADFVGGGLFFQRVWIAGRKASLTHHRERDGR